MDIKFSRHSKRRMKLYGLSEDVIISVIKRGSKSTNNSKISYLLKTNGNKFPIKVVTVKKNDYIYKPLCVYPVR